MGDVTVDKIPIMENLVDLFTTTLMGKVFVDHRDKIGFR